VFDAGGTPDYYNRTEICRQRMGPVLKRIMMNFPPVLFHPINTITAYKGQFIYDTPETQAKAQTPVSQLKWQPLPGVNPPTIPPGTDPADLLLPQTDPGR
jgi:phospholipid/cholesterol/gamma-HCH transport system substrate-binding protein